VRTKVKPYAIITIVEAKENSVAVNSLYNGRKFPLLIDSRKMTSITKEARDFFSLNNRDSSVNSMGFVIDSSVSKTIGNFFIAISKPRVPVRLFTSEETALQWLNQYL